MTYSRFHPGKNSLWLDWETSGADFDKPYPDQAKMFQGLQLGLIVADNETFNEVDSMKVNIRFNPKYKWQMEAQKIHGLTQEFLEENGVPQDEAAVEVIEFISKHFGQEPLYVLSDAKPHMKSKVCFGGHNLEFDIAHLKELLSVVDFGVMDHHVKLNTSTIGFHAVNEYKSDTLFTLFGAEKRGEHDALADTRQALAVARGIKELILKGLTV